MLYDIQYLGVITRYYGPVFFYNPTTSDALGNFLSDIQEMKIGVVIVAIGVGTSLVVQW